DQLREDRQSIRRYGFRSIAVANSPVTSITASLSDIRVESGRHGETLFVITIWLKVFPSAKLTTPLGRDNAWRGLLAPRLKTVQLEWATFQIMRRTHASLSRQGGIDPTLVADQRGHGLGVNLDVYTVAALDKRQDAVEVLESALACRGSD